MQSFGAKGRLEDERMLKGRGRYVSDWDLPRQAHAHFVRSSSQFVGSLSCRSDEIGGSQSTTE